MKTLSLSSSRRRLFSTFRGITSPIPTKEELNAKPRMTIHVSGSFVWNCPDGTTQWYSNMKEAMGHIESLRKLGSHLFVPAGA